MNRANLCVSRREKPVIEFGVFPPEAVPLQGARPAASWAMARRGLS